MAPALRIPATAELPRLAWLTIDLEALVGNLATLRALAGSGRPVHPVVKADAYGHGAVPIARALEAAGADGFCVATIDEALELRRARIRRPIQVLYPIPSAWAQEAARRRIAIPAGDPEFLDHTVRALEGWTGRRLGIQLEVETGLGRGGMIGDALVSAARTVTANRSMRLDGLWTHLQAAEDPDITARQLAAFDAAADALRQAGVRIPVRHVRASGSLLTEGAASYDSVRPGLSIYGLVPDELADRPLSPHAQALRPVLSLKARPVRVANLPAGWGISYGPTFRTAGPSRIATLPLGYGDGWSRSLSNAAEALVRGVRVPLVGTVAMDAIMADVTKVPGPPVTIDDEFVLIGRQGSAQITVADLARRRTTNSWEVVTNMARRLPRVYDAAAGSTLTRTLVSGGDG
ncbi:MAG: alanine racemase [Chloroflexota bacterium]